ncbi:phage tail tube protein [Mycobacteroides abscessus]|uniref:phage tail tube protein n=1 Tax=Mycobacteroides abscessus TaxID=36809 RepID=UPI0009299E54|nr:hypothetical protein [Mycobacteroides abscessus]SKS05148.1 Phage associated (putative structural protein) [Mycobacteroides abscessus subsp. abscessus]SHU53908.1 Phage associated (putative structural protein) [Mycobacteroides abscessus subsp. bolletii]SHW62600.1 Phage associated (putative structural protein) [Mycobacteroides abscessus subsp. bolletii]SHW90590.1 Phage associated (putative structural protein) [Mycobacteroides abscessus subsp. bolletii]SHX34899.1 Phage associated (putative stru
MAADVKNVYAAEPLVTGSVLVAPLGTAGPTDATAALPVAWVDLGYAGEDGFTESTKRDTKKKKAFGGATTKVLQTDFSATIKLKLQESLNAEVLKAVYGATNVTVTAASATHGAQVKVRKNKRKLPHLSWVIDTQDSELGAKYRNYIPDGQITELGDVTIVHTDTIEYEITIEAFENAQGDNIITFTDDGQLTP